MKLKYLALLICTCFFLQGYEYEYNVPKLNATNNAAARNNKGIMYMEMGQYGAAMTEFKIAVSLNPDSPASSAYYNNLGLVYMKFGQLKEAQECFERAIELNHVFLEYHKNLVRLYAQAGVLEKHLAKYEADIVSDKMNSKAYFMAGLISAEIGNKKEAVKYLKRFVKLERNQILARGVSQYIEEIKSPFLED